MNSYTKIVERQMRLKKKRNILTLLGIIIAVILFTSIGEYSSFIKQYNIVETKYYEGNAEGVFYNIPYEKIKFIENNVQIKDFSLLGKEFEGQEYINNQTQNLKIYSVDKNFIENTYKDSINLLEGKYPISSNEIILERKAKEEYKKKIGDEFKAGDKTYKISGFFQGVYTNTQDMIGLSNIDNPSKYDKISIFVRVSKSKGKIEVLDKIANDLDVQIANYNNIYALDKNDESYLEYNSSLLYYTGEDMTGYMMVSQKLVEFIMISIVFISTVVLIYSSINSSIVEKMNQLSLLKCIGATPSQIRGIIYKEALILGCISIIPGILIGHSITWFVINIVLKNKMQINFYNIDTSLSLKVVIGVVLITSITIIISTIKPALKASKISLMQGIKNDASKSENNLKKRKSKFLRHILGVEGELAYRNLRANNRSFIITTLALAVSLVMFLVFTCYVNAMITGINKMANNRYSDVEIFTYSDITQYIYDNYDYSVKDQNFEIDDKEYIDCMLSRINEDNKILDKVKSDLKSDKIAKKMYRTSSMGKDILIENIKSYNRLFATTDLIYNDELNGTVFHNGEIIVYDDTAFNKIEKFVTGENVNLKDFKNNGVIFVNPINVNFNGEIYEKNSTNFKSNEKINIYPVNSIDSEEIYTNPKKSDLEETKKFKIPLKVVGNIAKNEIIEGNKEMDDDTFSIIISENTYNKYKDKMVDGNLNNVAKHTLGFDYYNPSIRKIYGEKLKDYITMNLGLEYKDYYITNQHLKNDIIGRSIIIYSFAGLTVLISVLNIINNRNSAILYRKKEFGTLMAIGMNKKDLIKSIFFEGIVNWASSCLLAIPISYISLRFIYANLIRQGEEISSKIPIGIFIIGILGMFLVNVLSTLIPIIKLNKFDMIDMIKNEE